MLGIRALLGLAGAALVLAGGAAHTAAPWSPPRTEHGHPDLQGLWDTGTKTPFQRPTSLGEKRSYTPEEAAEFERKAQQANAKLDAPVDLTAPIQPVATVGQEADSGSIERRHDLTRVAGEYRTSIIIDPPNGRLPVRKDFVDFFGQLQAKGSSATDGPDTLDTFTRCLPALPVPTLFPLPWNAYLQIVQTRHHVLLFSEAPHEARIVRLDGSHLQRDLRSWTGNSVGRWEGNTLVVHTLGFRPEQSYAMVLPMSEELELTEQFTPVGKDEVLYRFTMVDPQAFTAPVTGERTIRRADPRDRILPYSCHEGNYSLEGILRGARQQEADAQSSRPLQR
jgi:hypothetical protein